MTKQMQLNLKQFQGEMVIFSGSGSGDIIRQCLALSHVSDILIYEPDQNSFGKLISQADIQTACHSGRLKIIGSQEKNSLKIELANFLYEDQSRIAKSVGMGIIQIEETAQKGGVAAADFIKLLEEVIRELVNELAANEEDSFWGLSNTLKNFPDYFNTPQFMDLKGLCQGATGVVVSTGPSLTASMELLKKCADRLVIFCCDSALLPLIKQGIVPDFVGCLERLYSNSFCFDNMPELENSCLVIPPVVMPETRLAYKGPCVQLHRDIGYENWVVPPRERLFMGSSVSHLCYVGLRILGCERIFLLGQDLSFDPVSGSSHHTKALTHQLEHGSQTILKSFSVQGFGSRTQTTTQVWNGFRNQFAELITRYGGEVLNLIPESRGIPIPLAARHDPEIFLDLQKLPAFDKGVFHTTVRQRLKPTPIDKHATQQLTNRISHSLKTIMSLCLKTLREISDFVIRHEIAIPNRGHEKKYQQFFVVLEQRQAELLEFDNGFFYEFILPLIGTSHVRIGYFLAQAFQEKDLVTRTMRQIELTMQWYHLVHFWCARALDLMDSTFQGSSNGRTTDSDSVNLGSNPSP